MVCSSLKTYLIKDKIKIKNVCWLKMCTSSSFILNSIRATRVLPKWYPLGGSTSQNQPLPLHLGLLKDTKRQNFCWFWGHWFWARVRTKWGRMPTCWTKKFQAMLPSFRQKKDQHWSRGERWSCLLWNNWRKPKHRKAQVCCETVRVKRHIPHCPGNLTPVFTVVLWSRIKMA